MQSIDELLKLINSYYKLAAKLDIGGSTPSMSYNLEESIDIPHTVDVPSLQNKELKHTYLKMSPKNKTLYKVIFEMAEKINILNQDFYYKINTWVKNIHINDAEKQHYFEFLSKIRHLIFLISRISSCYKNASFEEKVNQQEVESFINNLNLILNYLNKEDSYFIKINEFKELVKNYNLLKYLLLDSIERIENGEESPQLSFEDEPEEKTKPLL